MKKIQQLPTQKATTSPHISIIIMSNILSCISLLAITLKFPICVPKFRGFINATPTSFIKSFTDISSTLYINNKTILHSFACTFEVDAMMAKTKKKTLDESVVANALSIPPGEYVCKNDIQRNWRGPAQAVEHVGLIRCNVKNLARAWHVTNLLEREECPRERGHKWCMAVVNSCYKVLG